MGDDRPTWARRMRAEREARGWSQSDVVAALRAHATWELPDDESMIRTLKGWEAGGHQPGPRYRSLIAETFGTVTAAMFPVPRDRDRDLVTLTGMDTVEMLTRLRTSTVDSATLDGLLITTDQLCSDYPHLPPEQLLTESRAWLHRVSALRERRLSLAQHREVLTLAGWLALLIGCVEYDTGDTRSAEATRRAALSLAEEAGNTEIQGWAYEMAAWFALTRGDYRGVIAADDQGRAVAGTHGVSVQLAAQRAKALARVGDRRGVEVALDQGRQLLEGMPYPANPDHHFVIDPTKFDFYAMDCYRKLGEDSLAETYASEIIQTHTDPDGTERSPMRIAEARITLGVVAARSGDLDDALAYGNRALSGGRKSLPSLAMVSGELASAVSDRAPANTDVGEYLARLRDVTSSR